MAGPAAIAKVGGKGISQIFKTPAPQRLDPNLTAPDPSLRLPSSEFLQAFLKNPSSILSLLPQTSALQQQGNSFLQNLLKQTPGQGVLDAATPIFNRNLQQGADILRQSGPRFNSNTERLVANQGQQALQDFNLFSQQVMQEGVNQQLTGAGLVNQQRGLDLSFLGPLMQQFFGTAFGAGGLTQPGTVTQAQPWWQQLLNAGSQVGGIATGLGGGKQGSATPTTVAGPGMPNTFNPPGFGSTFGQGWGWQ